MVVVKRAVQAMGSSSGLGGSRGVFPSHHKHPHLRVLPEALPLVALPALLPPGACPHARPIPCPRSHASCRPVMLGLMRFAASCLRAASDPFAVPRPLRPISAWSFTLRPTSVTRSTTAGRSSWSSSPPDEPAEKGVGRKITVRDPAGGA